MSLFRVSNAFKLLHAGVVRRAVCELGARYIRFVFRTTRWRWVGRPYFDQMAADPKFVGAMWHSRMLMIPALKPPHRTAVGLVSNNRDGDFIAEILERTNVEAIRGSSRDPLRQGKVVALESFETDEDQLSEIGDRRDPTKHRIDRGGANAAPKLIGAVNQGKIVVLTPDGPRGPRMRVKPGVVAIAAVSGAAVLPMAYAVRRAFIFRSWDRFMLPAPFSSGAWVFGEPIQPPRDRSPEAIEEKRAELEAAMIEITQLADRLVGREVIEPAEPVRQGLAIEVATKNGAAERATSATDPSQGDATVVKSEAPA